MKKILGIGNALTDILLQVSEQDLQTANFPKGSMYLIDSGTSDALKVRFSDKPRAMVAGGSSSNTINGIARLGGDAAFIGKVGKDEIGNFYAEDMRKNGVTPFVLESETASGNCTVLITPDCERTMRTYLGAACELNAEDLKQEFFDGYDIVHIEGYLIINNDLVLTAAKMAKKAGAMISIDLASYNVVEENFDFLQSYINEYVDIVFANEEEAQAFTGKSSCEALDELAKVCEIAVVKEGAAGSHIKRGAETVKINAIKVNAIDTTGAGDLYAAGFLFALAQDKPLQTCGELGALISGKTVEVIGPKISEETWAEIKQTYNV